MLYQSTRLVHTIFLSSKNTVYYIFHMDLLWNKQKILVLVFSMFNALPSEYKCLWGLIRSVICDTECNITAVAIAWLASVWDWDKMPSRISCTWQFECDSGRELVQIYWIFNRKRGKKTLKLIKYHGLFSYRAVFMTFCLLWESALNKYCGTGSYICLLAICNYKPPITLQEGAERGPVTLVLKWLCSCFYAPVMLTKLYSVFLFICFLFIEVWFTYAALWEKMLKWNKRMKFLWCT